MGFLKRFSRLLCCFLALCITIAGASAAPLTDYENIKTKPTQGGADGLHLEAREPHFLDWLEKVYAKGASAYEGPSVEAYAEKGIQPRDNDFRYDSKAYLLSEDYSGLTFIADVPETGLYELSFDYFILPEGIGNFMMTILINKEIPYVELKTVELPRYWLATGEGDLLNPKDDSTWRGYTLCDSTLETLGALLIYLNKGRNRIELNRLTGTALIGGMTLDPPSDIPWYKEYRSLKQGNLYEGNILTIEGEEHYSKKGTSISVLHDSDPLVHPQSAADPRPNTIGGRTWKAGGEGVLWKVGVEEAGYYRLSIKYLNNFKINMPVFRSILINGRVPFKELEAYPFPFSTDWANMTLSTEDGDAYEIWLEEGENTIELTATPSPYTFAIRRIDSLISRINSLYIELRMVTGNQQDYDRDWRIVNFCPDAVSRLEAIAAEFDRIYGQLGEISGNAPDAVRNLKLCSEQIRNLIKEPDKIMVRYSMLSEDSGSIVQMAGEARDLLVDQSLKIDRLYVHGDNDLPRARSSFIERY
jgi:hypothetical protein